MTYRVEELAVSGGVSVDTIRYYQGLGLLQPPRRAGRVALYDESHAHRLGRIRELADSGFTLRQIGELVERAGRNGEGDPLLEVLAKQRPAPATMTPRGSCGAHRRCRTATPAWVSTPDSCTRRRRPAGRGLMTDKLRWCKPSVASSTPA